MYYDILGLGLKTGLGIVGLVAMELETGLVWDIEGLLPWEIGGNGCCSGSTFNGYFLRIGLMRFSF